MSENRTTLAVVTVKIWIEVDPDEDIDMQVNNYLSTMLDETEYEVLD